MKFFIYDNVNEKVILNKEGILLVKEFSDLLEEKVGKEPKGKKSFAFRAFTYIYLFLDWESPYFNLPEQERHEEALNTAGLSDEEFNNPVFKAACNKYNEIQNSALSIRLLRSAMLAVETVIYYLENVDISERDTLTGKPVYKTKDLIAEIKGCKDLISGLQDLEKQVKKDIEPDSGLRGNTEAGMFD